MLVAVLRQQQQQQPQEESRRPPQAGLQQQHLPKQCGPRGVGAEDASEVAPVFAPSHAGAPPPRAQDEDPPFGGQML